MTTENKINIVLAIFNGLMLVVTVVLVWITLMMANIANHSLDHQISKDSADAIIDSTRNALSVIHQQGRDNMSDSMNARNLRIAQRSIEIADSSIKLTKRQLLLTERTAKLDLRAYIVLSDGNFSDFRVGHKSKFSYELKNVGKTPAYKVTTSYSWGLGESAVWKQADSMKTIIADTGRSISPSIPSRGELTPIDLERIDSIAFFSKGLHFYWLFGVSYVDIFGETHHSITQFVYDFNRKQLVFTGNHQYAN